MAGIGFRLRRLAEEEGLSGFFASYAAAAAIMAGPWIITILTVCGVSLLGTNLAPFEVYITHVYQVSLISVGFLQFPATRYLADLLYKQEYGKVFPAFNTTLMASLLLSTSLGSLWLFTTPNVDMMERVLAVVLLNVITTQWVALVFLVTIHRYRGILAAFSLGGFLSVFLTLYIFGPNSTILALLGFTLGQALTTLLLVAFLMREYPAYQFFDPAALSWVRRAPALVFAGGFFYIGTFADKFAYRYAGWCSQDPLVGHVVVEPWLAVSHPYESLTFLAQLTVIPALAIFYIQVETGFFEVYKAFYATIDNRGTLGDLTYIKERILEQMALAGRSVCASQGVVTVICILIAPELFPGFAPSDLEQSILRASMLASFFGILVLLTLVIYLYFEFYWEACGVAVLYTFLNASFTLFGLLIGTGAHGWGAVLASLITCLVSARLLWIRVDDLLYQTFSKSPVETLPGRASGVPGVGRFHFQKGDIFS